MAAAYSNGPAAKQSDAWHSQPAILQRISNEHDSNRSPSVNPQAQGSAEGVVHAGVALEGGLQIGVDNRRLAVGVCLNWVVGADNRID